MATFIDAPTATRARTKVGTDNRLTRSWRSGKSRHVVKDVDPFTGETLVEIPAADTQDKIFSIGLHSDQSQLQHLRKHIEDARSARIPAGPRRRAERTRSSAAYFREVSNERRAKGDEDALCIANSTEYGLSSSVFTSDSERGARFAERLEAGMSHVNDQPVNDLPNNPFGGEKLRHPTIRRRMGRRGVYYRSVGDASAPAGPVSLRRAGCERTIGWRVVYGTAEALTR